MHMGHVHIFPHPYGSFESQIITTIEKIPWNEGTHMKIAFAQQYDIGWIVKLLNVSDCFMLLAASDALHKPTEVSTNLSS